MSQQILDMVEKASLKTEVSGLLDRRYGRCAHEDSGRRQRTHPDFHGCRDCPQRFWQPGDVHRSPHRGQRGRRAQVPAPLAEDRKDRRGPRRRGASVQSCTSFAIASAKPCVSRNVAATATSKSLRLNMASTSKLRAWLAERFSAKPKSFGERGEDAAARYLKRQGFRILERGHDSPLGEIDIIAVDGRTVVFVEVKTRASTDAGHPTEAIDDRQAAAYDAGGAGVSKVEDDCWSRRPGSMSSRSPGPTPTPGRTSSISGTRSPRAVRTAI